MSTPLYKSDIKKPSQLSKLTELQDNDIFVVEDVGEGEIKVIERKDLKKDLGVEDVEQAIQELTDAKTTMWNTPPSDDKYPSEKLVSDAITALKGVGYTDGTLKTHEDRLDTLEGDDTTEGSVAKTVKDAVEPVKGTGWTDENLVDHEERIGDLETNDTLQDATLGTLKETVLSTKLAVNELERQAQIGNGATLDFEDIGIVPLDARATGRANPTVEGRTATNLVKNGDFSAGTTGWVGTNSLLSVSNKILSVTGNGTNTNPRCYVEINGSSGVYFFKMRIRVTNPNCTLMKIYWSSVLTGINIYDISNPVENQWYEIVIKNTMTDADLTNQIFILHQYASAEIANGKVMEIDGNYGVTAINLTSIYGAGNEPSEADCAKIFSYFSGTKSITMPARLRSRGKNLWNPNSVRYASGTYATESGYVRNANVTGAIVFSFDTEIGQVLSISNVVITGTARIRIEDYCTGASILGFSTFTKKVFTAIGRKTKIYLDTTSTDWANKTEVANIMLNLGSTKLPYEPYTDSTLYIADNEEVRSVPAISDEVKVVNGQLVKVQNVQRYVLQESDVENLTTSLTSIDVIGIAKKTDNIIYNDNGGAIEKAQTILFPNFRAISATGIENIVNVGGIYNASLVRYALVVPKGTYASLAEAKADLAGTIIYYQLATPIITPLLTSGTLQAKQNGTVYFEPYYEGSHQTDTSSQITLPYEGTIKAVYGYDEDLVEYLLDSSEYSRTGTTLTITDALENDVFFVQMSRSEPLAPEMSVNVINNDQVTLDSADGKYYQIGFTTTNGVPTVTATEVV